MVGYTLIPHLGTKLSSPLLSEEQFPLGKTHITSQLDQLVYGRSTGCHLWSMGRGGGGRGGDVFPAILLDEFCWEVQLKSSPAALWESCRLNPQLGCTDPAAPFVHLQQTAPFHVGAAVTLSRTSLGACAALETVHNCIATWPKMHHTTVLYHVQAALGPHT